jgi:hypothetical protein
VTSTAQKRPKARQRLGPRSPTCRSTELGILARARAPEIRAKHGLLLEELNADGTETLPMPTVIDAEHQIVNAYPARRPGTLARATRAPTRDLP